MFGENAQVLSAEITEKKPHNLKAVAQKNGDKAELEPVLLNSKDYITIKILTASYQDNPKIEARIKGINTIRKMNSSSPGFSFVIVIAVLSTFIGVGIAIISKRFSGYYDPHLILTLIICYIFGHTATNAYLRLRKKK